MKNPDFKWSENGLETRLYIWHFVTDIPLSFEAFLYQTANYLNEIDLEKKYSFYLFITEEIPAVASIHFTRNDTGFISQARAPFGGIECDKKCNEEEINFLLRCVSDWFSSKTDCLLKVKTAPACYNSVLKNILFTSTYEYAEYKISNKLINYHIPVSKSSFSQNITSSEARRLSKCKKSDFRAGLYDNPDTEIVYNFIKESRAAKGYLMLMTIDQLAIMINNFPEQCRVFVVTDGTKIIALAITVLVSKRVLYNFLPADLPEYKSFSPMVLLIEAIYNYCQKEDIVILDLGISLDNEGNEKASLLKFKKNLGGEPSFKITYEKQLKLVN